VPNLHNVKSKVAAAAILNFEENVNNFGLDIDLCTEFGLKMRHGYAKMFT